MVAALPFASAGQFVSALDLAGDEGEARSRYAYMFQLAAIQLTKAFRPDAVNLFMAHTHLEGTSFGSSERRVHIGEQWAGSPQDLPAQAQYIALGHIHMPQKVEGQLPAYYAGSPLQLDFGEVNDEKSFLLVDVEPGKPSRVERHPYIGGKRLLHWEGTWAEMMDQAENLSEAGWLRIQLELDERDPEIYRKVREHLPNAVAVLPPIVPEEEGSDPTPPPGSRTPIEHYEAFYRKERKEAPKEHVAVAFQDLYDQAMKNQDDD